MKSKAVVTALTVAALSFGSLSFAQNSYDQRGPGNPPQRVDQRAPQPPQRVDNRNDRRDTNNNERTDYNAPRGFDNHRDARNDRNFGARGPQFQRGGRIPTEYRRNQYVVNDWRGHHLQAPPRGQHWVQVGADYALVAIATGVIAQLVLNSR